MHRSFTLAASLVAVSAAGSASAEFIAVDTFDTYPIGDTLAGKQGENGQERQPGQFQFYFGGNLDETSIIPDTEGGDQAVALRQTGGGQNVGKVLTSEDGSDATVFLQFRVEPAVTGATTQNTDISFGGSDAVDGAKQGYAVRIQTGAGGGLQLTDTANRLGAELDLGATYNFFAVLPNGTVDNQDAAQIFIQSDDDGDFSSLTRIDGGAAAFDYRTVAGRTNPDGDLNIAFNNRTATPFIVDNLFVDGDGANLVNPVPEPASAALLAAGSLALLRRRKG